MPDTRQLVTKKEAARLLGCSLRTVERRIEAGELATGPPLHTRHGAATRVWLDAPPDGPATADATPTPDDGPDLSGVVAPSQGTDSAATTDARLLLATLAEFAREREALARRLGQAEAERDALRAQLAELQEQAHQSDTAGAQRGVQRLWRWFWRKGGDNA